MGFREFAVRHDDLKIFVIPYVLLSAVVAVVFGLFYFFIWILAHFFLELYKRKKIFGRVGLEDVFIALQHCRMDFFFFFLGISIDALTHTTGSIALGRLGGLFRSERALEGAGALARFVGTAKVTKSVAQVAEELREGRISIEPGRFRATKFDVAVALVSFASVLASALSMYFAGYSAAEIVKAYILVLSP